MILTTTMNIQQPPTLSRHGDNIKLDFGPFTIETSVPGLKILLGTIITQAAKKEIYITIK